MKPILARRPSPATAIACVALFVALGGVSYGFATGSIDTREIADNTVRSKDIRNNNILTRDLRNNDIRGIDVRNNTLRGRDMAPDSITDDQIDESKLAQVPSALNADRLGGLAAGDYARAAQGPLHVVGASGEPQFETGFGAAADGSLPPAFWKDSLGVVHLEGTVSNGGISVMFTLPAGHRPGGTVRFAVPEGPAGTAVVEIDAAGEVSVSGPSAPIALDGIAFRAQEP